MIRIFAATLVFVMTAAAADAPAPDINLAAFANGGIVESVDSNYGNDWDANWLIDENPKLGWATVKQDPLPATIVLSLPESSEIHELGFDTASAETEDRSAKDIDVYGSASSASDGFALLASITLKPMADGQVFPLAQPFAPVRFIKLVIKSSYGSVEYAEMMEFRAMGLKLTTTPMPESLSGTYEATHFGKFHLLQNGAQLSGCYELNGGLIFGGLEDHLMRLRWVEAGGKGPALMVLARDGSSFKGWWAYEQDPLAWHADWNLKKISKQVGSCPHWNPADAGGMNGGIVGSQLASEGRVRLYGINFDLDKDRLRDDAMPAVGELLAALKGHGDWTVSIEGHTDSTGTPEHNLDLSQRRAASVKAALVAGGIDAARLTTKGFGQTVPVASNDTDIGRAQNRRVEVVRQ